MWTAACRLTSIKMFRSESIYFTVVSPNIDRNVVARGQMICSCSIIDAMVHSLPPFLAFVLSLDARAGWVAEDTVQTTPQCDGECLLGCMGRPLTLFHLEHSCRLLDAELTQRAASLSCITHCAAAVTQPKAPDQHSGLSHAAIGHCAEQPLQMSSYKLKATLIGLCEPPRKTLRHLVQHVLL